MPRYIDADACVKEVEKESNQDGSYGYMDTKSIVDLINDAPTVDVVEVVRCKDCIHGIPESYDTVTMKSSDELYCYRHHMCHFEDYYCADGKRKGGGAE